MRGAARTRRSMAPGVSPTTARSPRFLAHFIRAGAQLCAFGRHSLAEGGIVPLPTGAASPRLIEGNLRQAMATPGSPARTRLLIAVLCALACGGLVAAFVAKG